jgi:S-DNA-T family DNA segregation ATPase FtsK/SpoIIIE
MLGALQQEDRTKAKRVEALIIRLAQKARAAGIHLIIN